MRHTIIIPAYRPGEKLICLLRELVEINAFPIVVVDDGSGSEYAEIFLAAEALGAYVVHRDQNEGKGAALKLGFSEALSLFGPMQDFITADADGQHLPQDILRVAWALEEHPGALILGSRDFSGAQVPRRSRFGNRITSKVFRLMTGVSCSDTQTGLRGIPRKLIPLAAETHGSRYEYEMNFLTAAARSAELIELPITTVYEENNACSHFRPVRDSVRIYAEPLKFLLASLSSAGIDYLMFAFLLMLPVPGQARLILTATVGARIVSGICNFLMNRYVSFRSRGSIRREAGAYGLLFVALMFASAGLVILLSAVMPEMTAKLIADTSLFFVSYVIQKRFIFNDTREVCDMNTENKKSTVRHRYVWAWCYGLLLTGYAVFALLHVFVIPHGRVSMEEAMAQTTDDGGAADETTNEDETDAVTSATEKPSGFGHKHYPKKSERGSGRRTETVESEKASSKADAEEGEREQTIEEKSTGEAVSGNGVSVTLTTEYVNNTKVYIADVVLEEGSSLLSGLAEDSFGRNITESTSTIAERNRALLAINGDFYGFRDTGYVIRNGYLYRSKKSSDTAQDLVVYRDGTMEIIREGDITAEELLEKGAAQVYSFGPGLVENGSVSVSEDDEVGQSMRSNPRTAIGYIDKNHYVFVVSDGRTSESEGLSLLELGELMQSLGCELAYNLDGGGSSTMYYQGEVVNNPTTNGNSIKERKVSDIVYIGE